MYHFWAQNGPFACPPAPHPPKKKFFFFLENYQYHSLAPFIVKNFKKIPTSDPEL